MNIKPLKKNHISFRYVQCCFDLELKSNLTFISSKSATGKTFLFHALEAWSLSHPEENILCLCHNDRIKMDISEKIKTCRNMMIVIDNADIILTDEIRKYIALDIRNQYVIIGRIVEGLLLTGKNRCGLEYDRKKSRFYLEY